MKKQYDILLVYMSSVFFNGMKREIIGYLKLIIHKGNQLV